MALLELETFSSRFDEETCSSNTFWDELAWVGLFSLVLAMMYLVKRLYHRLTKVQVSTGKSVEPLLSQKSSKHIPTEIYFSSAVSFSMRCFHLDSNCRALKNVHKSQSNSVRMATQCKICG